MQGCRASWRRVAIASLAAALGLYYAAASYFYVSLRGGRPWLASLLFAALWTGAEMARGTWLTGFGWGATGYAHLDGWLAPYIPWLGAYGVTALAAWLAANLAQLRSVGRVSQSLSVLVLAAGAWASYAPAVLDPAARRSAGHAAAGQYSAG